MVQEFWFSFVPGKGKIKYLFISNIEVCPEQKKTPKFIEAKTPNQILLLNHGFQ